MPRPVSSRGETMKEKAGVRDGATITLHSEVPVWKWPRALQTCFTAATMLERRIQFVSLKLRAEDLALHGEPGVLPKERLIVEFAWQNEVFATGMMLSQNDEHAPIHISDHHRGVAITPASDADELLEGLVEILRIHGKKTIEHIQPQLDKARLLVGLKLKD